MTLITDSSSRFEALPEFRCKELLAAHSAGRVAWLAPDGPCVLPVTYAYHNGEIVFRTSTRGVLSTLAHRCRVAFEIDDIDEDRGEGWNVLVRGASAQVVHRYQQIRLWQEGPVPWASGPRTLFIAISPERITGRLVRAHA